MNKLRDIELAREVGFNIEHTATNEYLHRFANRIRAEAALERMAENERDLGIQMQPSDEPVAYDKTDLNCFVQDLYDKKMQEGKHGHYETMFHCVHQAIKKVCLRPQPAAQCEYIRHTREGTHWCALAEKPAAWVGLADEERNKLWRDVVKWGDPSHDDADLMKAIEAKLKEKNT